MPESILTTKSKTLLSHLNKHFACLCLSSHPLWRAKPVLRSEQNANTALLVLLKLEVQLCEYKNQFWIVWDFIVSWKIKSEHLSGMLTCRNTELLTCVLCLSGHSGVQKEAETSEDSHARWHSEDRHGWWLQDCQWHAHDNLCKNRSVLSCTAQTSPGQLMFGFNISAYWLFSSLMTLCQNIDGVLMLVYWLFLRKLLLIIK